MEQRDEDGTLIKAAKPTQISGMLERYRDRGVVDYKKTLAIPMDQRIPYLVTLPKGRLRVSVALSAALASAFAHIKTAKLSAEQLVEIAEGIIDTSHEDQLSVEDILLFLKDLLMGKYGKLSNGLDMPTFFEILEDYRQDRYKTLRNARWEEHLTFKSLGDSNRSFDDLPLKRNDDPVGMATIMQTNYEERPQSEA
jgi:hypothetical protein